MSKAKSIKLITLISMLIISLVCAFGLFTTPSTASAASIDKAGIFKYETSKGSAVKDIDFVKKGDDTFAVIPMMEEEKLSFYRLLVIDDFEMVFTVGEDVNAFSVNFPMASYIATGNKKVDGTETSYVKTVDNKVSFVKTATGYDVTLNGETASITSSDVTLALTIEDNILNANVNGVDIAPATEDVYKVKVEDKATSAISFEVTDLKDGVTSSTIDLRSVDTKASEGTMFEQNFTLKADGSAFESNSTPRYRLNEAFINETGKLPSGVSVPAGKVLDGIVVVGEEYSVTTTAYYLASIDSNQPKIKAEIDLDPTQIDENVKYVVTPDTKKIKFTTPGFYNVSLVSNANESVVYETYYVYARSAISESEAPKYNNDVAAKDSFYSALIDNLYTDETKEKYIALGAGQYLTLPSMESLVSDDITSYKNLTKTIYYTTPETSSSYSSGDKIPVESAGDYSFYVVFKDRDGNAMKSEDFISYDPLDPNDITYGEYQDYIFRFTIYDNANLEVSGRTQGTAYVGINYTATNFEIEAGQNTKTYKLYYSATRTKTPTDTYNYDWKEVVVSSKATDPELTYNGLTYDDVVAINYTGALTFTPHATGYYKLTCMVTSASSVRSDEAEVIIESKTPITVEPIVFASNVNVPQIIFLSVGGACLVGIVALLFVKPKQKKED